MKKEKLLSLLLVSGMMACSNGPLKIEEQNSPEAEQAAQSIFEKPGSNKANSNKAEHQVKALEILESDRYSYLRVSEGEDEYWIATIKGSFAEGETYIYGDGLYKTDYFSTEFNRSFDRIYLVSDLRAKNAPAAGASSIDKLVGIQQSSPISETDYDREGSIKIKDLLANSEKYANKEVQITAKVVKVNPAIMDRNWLHLKDGSFDDFDLVATSMEGVPAGHIVTIKGTLVLDRDFGAGYHYDLIIENATLVP
ncbi:MAG: hypothetical protein DA405_04140 [Bacteroidetes bacterium]|nr:MAG: hypothetical protein DA405_04140 [Bacteroidota bacterium]